MASKEIPNMAAVLCEVFVTTKLATGPAEISVHNVEVLYLTFECT